MGWSNCGADSKGRPIGYGFTAECDYPGCVKAIDRGLAYACGGMHGGGEGYCEEYFCSEHLVLCDGLPDECTQPFVCELCARANEELDHEGEWPTPVSTEAPSQEQTDA